LLEAGDRRYIEHPLVWPETVEYRLYQKRIADVASEKNTLVILPTALGKTVISTLVAADILYNYRSSWIKVLSFSSSGSRSYRSEITSITYAGGRLSASCHIFSKP